MPRNYNKKHVTHTQEQYEKAIELSKTSASIREIAKTVLVPRETIRRWLTTPKPRKIGSGGVPILSESEEEQIVAALRYSADLGHPLKREDLKVMVQSFVKSQKRKTPFKDDKPGDDFCRLFERRHPSLGAQVPELVTVQRNRGLTQANLDEFFKMFDEIVEKNNLHDKPERFWNIDETGLTGNPISGKAYARKGSHAVVLNPNCGKTSYSVMFCISASGIYLPPFVVYKAAHLYDNWTKGGPKDAVYTATESGWMQDKNFEKWVETVFVKAVQHLEKPVVLIMDGHGSHLTYPTVQTCLKNDILLICLPPHTSHALQPLDVGVFRSLKAIWKDVLEKFRRQARTESVDKNIFPPLLKRACEELSNHPELAIAGFRGS